MDSRYGRLYWNVVDQRITESIPSEDEDDAVNDQGVSYGDVHTAKDIQTMGPIEQIDPFKRAIKKRDYNFISTFKSTPFPGFVEQSEFVQKASKKSNINSLSAPKSLRHSYRKYHKLEASSKVQHFDISL